MEGGAIAAFPNTSGVCSEAVFAVAVRPALPVGRGEEQNSEGT